MLDLGHEKYVYICFFHWLGTSTRNDSKQSCWPYASTKSIPNIFVDCSACPPFEMILLNPCWTWAMKSTFIFAFFIGSSRPPEMIQSSPVGRTHQQNRFRTPLICTVNHTIGAVISHVVLGLCQSRAWSVSSRICKPSPSSSSMFIISNGMLSSFSLKRSSKMVSC